jgi:hypothetical protein
MLTVTTLCDLFMEDFEMSATTHLSEQVHLFLLSLQCQSLVFSVSCGTLCSIDLI